MYLAIFMTIVMVSDVSLSFFINFVMINKLLSLVSLKFQTNVGTALRNSIAKHGDFTQKCVTEFHGNTGGDNRIVLLSTKLSILNFLAAATSVLSVLLFLFASRSGLA